jgi:hypothetical protein
MTKSRRKAAFDFFVTPAKAGVQALNGIARSARDLKT